LHSISIFFFVFIIIEGSRGEARADLSEERVELGEAGVEGELRAGPNEVAQVCGREGLRPRGRPVGVAFAKRKVFVIQLGEGAHCHRDVLSRLWYVERGAGISIRSGHIDIAFVKK
jgi:hypothetical protein